MYFNNLFTIQFCIEFTLYALCSMLYVLQNSQVDLLAKSEIFDSIAVVCDIASTPLGWSGGKGLQAILKNGSCEDVFSFILSRNVMH